MPMQQTGDLYTGYLAIITNQEYRNHEIDLLFQFTCKTNNDVPHRIPGQVFERNIKVNRQDLFDNSPWPKLDVKFTVKDENGQSVQTILESTPIRFEAELIDELNVYKAVTVEECYVIDRIKSGQRNEDSKETLLLYKGYPSACDSTTSTLNNPRITFLPPSLRIIQRSIPLYLIESIPSSQLPVKKKVPSRICDELYCSNTLHILLMISLIGILTCLMGVMGMLLARKYRHHLNHTRNSLIQSKSLIIKQNHCTQSNKNYYNPIKQSSRSQYLIHKPHVQLDQHIDNDIIKNTIQMNTNGSQ
ncbi:hypothetical protein Smp_156800 [Schistosoma mansoni]|uniref:hypothetical protein n=1 Tax=Schistosoma mansoni TaxID=6183 RepID=UPI00019B382E|nr:hypothetical protein Smp_156800 [Schistosoma mansoni]|eukprot:XP_018646511.1 hypothetical protein Smp_156800 [Schistosoma mansoni]